MSKETPRTGKKGQSGSSELQHRCQPPGGDRALSRRTGGQGDNEGQGDNGDTGDSHGGPVSPPLPPGHSGPGPDFRGAAAVPQSSETRPRFRGRRCCSTGCGHGRARGDRAGGAALNFAKNSDLTPKTLRFCTKNL